MGMTDEKIFAFISSMDQKQHEALEKYLEHQMILDIEEVEVKKKKYAVYHEYADTIADLVAKIEVYAHDLPRQICGLIEMTFRILSVASVEKAKDKELILYDVALKYEKFLINILYLTLIDIYVKEIRRYRRVFKKFKYRAIKLDNGIFIKQHINNQLCVVSSLVKKSKKTLKVMYSINEWHLMIFLDKLPFVEKLLELNVDIGIENNSDIQELICAFNLAEEVMDICEVNYSKIINNGYNSTFIRRILHIVPTIISVVLAVLGAITIYYRMVG